MFSVINLELTNDTDHINNEVNAPGNMFWLLKIVYAVIKVHTFMIIILLSCKIWFELLKN